MQRGGKASTSCRSAHAPELKNSVIRRSRQSPGRIVARPTLPSAPRLSSPLLFFLPSSASSAGPAVSMPWRLAPRSRRTSGLYSPRVSLVCAPASHGRLWRSNSPLIPALERATSMKILFRHAISECQDPTVNRNGFDSNHFLFLALRDLRHVGERD